MDVPGSGRPFGAQAAPAAAAEQPMVLETRPGESAQVEADRLAELTARAAGAATGLIHMTEGRRLLLIGGYALPDGFTRMQALPRSSTLSGLVVQGGFPLIVGDVRRDPRVPRDAPSWSVGVRSYAGFPVRDPDGDIAGVCAVADYVARPWHPDELTAVDVGAQACTALVANLYAQQAIEGQRRFLNTLLDSLETGVLACDADGRLVVVNRALRERLGLEPVDGPPSRWLPLLPLTTPEGDAVTAGDMTLLRALEGQQIRNVERILRTVSGAKRWFTVNAHPIVGSGGGRLGAVSVFHDVTDRRRADRFRGCELAVMAALNEASSVAEAAPRALAAVAGTLGWPCAELWLVDDDGEGLRRVERYQAPGFDGGPPAPAGLRRGEGLAGQAWEQGQPIWSSTQTGPAPGRAPAPGGIHTALAIPVASGERVLAVVTLFADEPEDPHDALVGLLSGIAAHFGLYLERRRAERLQRDLSTAKDEYLNLVGHELRTPLTVIGSYADLLEEADPDTTLAEARPLTDAIARGSDRLRRLVEALLDLAALDSGHAHIDRRPVDLAQVVAAAVRHCAERAAAEDLTVDCDLPDALGVLGDAGRLAQLVAALLDNAITYTPGGGRIGVRLTAWDDEAHLAVTDTGPGIPGHERSHVFQRFYRGAIATEQAIAGAGLGLSIARLIAERHHGSIAIGEAGNGTAVHLRLPMPRGG